MLTSAATTLAVTWAPVEWSLGPLSPGGAIAHEGRLVIVAGASLTAALVVIAIGPRPDPASLTDFYRRLRPAGAWGPVRALAGVEAPPRGELRVALVGVVAGLALIFGTVFALGHLLLGRPFAALVLAVPAIAGGWGVSDCLRKLVGTSIDARVTPR